MRVLHLHDPFGWGGLETWLVRLLPHLQSDDLQVDFMATHVDPVHANRMRELGSRLFLAPRPKRTVPFLARLTQVLRRFGPYEVVHTHYPQHSGLILLAAYHAGVPIRIAHSHSDVRAIPTLRPLSRFYMTVSNMLVPRFATCGVADSRSAAEFLFGLKWHADQRWTVLPLGIDFTPFTAANSRAQFRAEHSIPQDAFVVVHVGRFSPEKNHDLILRTMSQAIRRDPAIMLILVGDGPLRPRIDQTIEAYQLRANVTILAPPVDVPRVLCAADAFLFPSLFEGFGLALVEAQAAGLRCLASNHIPAEADVVPSLVKRLDAEASADIWAEAVLQCKRTQPNITKEHALAQVQRSPYNIIDSATQLRSLYARQKAITNCR
jgi:glycosyltransferase involved in cell wall biosynthesis